MRYVDAGGCIKSLKIVPKQRRRHKKKSTMNSVFFLHWEAFVFQDCLHIQCDLVLQFFLENKLPIYGYSGEQEI